MSHTDHESYMDLEIMVHVTRKCRSGCAGKPRVSLAASQLISLPQRRGEAWSTYLSVRLRREACHHAVLILGAAEECRAVHVLECPTK
eukprot:scaffold284311_cov15-Tisochrysis_lutea.AAC.1